jgi:hypothetical protein
VSCHSQSGTGKKTSLHCDTLSIPLRGDEIDRWQRHTSLRQFAADLQEAAKSVYQNGNRSRYSNVYVLIIKWEFEDPKLPVSCEIKELYKVLDEIYHYDIEIFEIPDNRSHAKVSQKINSFIEINNDNKYDLKIVYYAGHSRLSKTRDLVWSRYVPYSTAVNLVSKNLKLIAVFRSWQNKKKPKCSTVTWTGIQQALQQAQSDVLVFLDCCSSGIGDVGEGNGVTELMTACAFDVTANGVGHYSFTKALTIELRLLSKKSSFPVGELYANVYCRIQYHLSQGIPGERYPAPIHLQLTRDDEFLRGLRLSIQPRPVPQKNCLKRDSFELRVDTTESTTPKRPLSTEPSPPEPSNKRPCCSNDSIPAVNDLLQLNDAPRLLFAIRLEENIRAEDLSTEYFVEWLRAIPTAVEEVKVEAGFKSDSTLLLVSLPLSLWPYLPQCPATFLLGPIRSSNLMAARHPHPIKLPAEVFSGVRAGEKTVAATVDNDDLDVVVPGELYAPSASSQRWLESDTPDGLGTVQHGEYLVQLRIYHERTLPHFCTTPKNFPINRKPIIETLDISNTINEVSDYNDKDLDSGIFTWSEGTSYSWRPNIKGDIPNTGDNILKQPRFACHFFKKDPIKYFPTTPRYRTCPALGITELRRIKFVPHNLWL